MEDLIDALFLWGFVQRVLPARAAAGVVPGAVLRACRALGREKDLYLAPLYQHTPLHKIY